VDAVLEAIGSASRRRPTAAGAPLRHWIFDSWFDPYLGAMVMVRLFDGEVRKGDRVRMVQLTHTTR